jgi:hypothetical protein
MGLVRIGDCVARSGSGGPKSGAAGRPRAARMRAARSRQSSRADENAPGDFRLPPETGTVGERDQRDAKFFEFCKVSPWASLRICEEKALLRAIPSTRCWANRLSHRPFRLPAPPVHRLGQKR